MIITKFDDVAAANRRISLATQHFGVDREQIALGSAQQDVVVIRCGFHLLQRKIAGQVYGCHLDPRLEPDLDAVGRLLAELGLGAHSVHTPFSGLNIGHPTLGDPALWRRLVGESIRGAGALGASACVVHVSSYQSPVPDSLVGDARAAVRDLVAELAEVAESAGTRVALENMIARSYWRQGTTLAELAADFPDPRIGFCLDTGHAALNRASQTAEVNAAGERLISIHAANNDGNTDLHTPPTEGVIDWSEVTTALDSIGYRHHLALETHGRGDPDVVLARLVRLHLEL
jgi:sugar phosphate isomerase/epimerase